MKWLLVLIVAFFATFAQAQQQIFLTRPIYGEPNLVVSTVYNNATKNPAPYITTVFDQNSPNNIVLTRISATQYHAQLQHDLAVEWSVSYYGQNEECGCEEADEEFRVFYLEQQAGE